MAGEIVCFDFSSPNIAKPFHAGHLRSTIIGNFMVQVHKANGAKTIGINYLGDWGKQYGILQQTISIVLSIKHLTLGLLAVGFQKYGSEEQLQAEPIKHLFDIYVRINAEGAADPKVHDDARAYFKRMEDGDEEALKVWQHFRDLSISQYKKMYKRLNIEFDEYSGESQVTDYMYRALDILEEKMLLVDSNGAQVLNLTPFGQGVAVIKKQDGTSLYLTRDLGTAMLRQEKYKFTKSYYIVASQQDLHFKQLFMSLGAMGLGDWVKGCQHISFGMVKGMKTRTGDVVFLEDILDEAKRSMHEVMKKNEEKYAQIDDPEKTSDIIGFLSLFNV